MRPAPSGGKGVSMRTSTSLKRAARAAACLLLGSLPARAQWQIESEDGSTNLRLGFLVQGQAELLDTAEKPGALGRVLDINLLYTTLEDATAPDPGTLLQIPNALIFQRVVRRWRAGTPVPAHKLHPTAASQAAAGAESTSAPKAVSFP